jgi:hypothetical protein
LRNAESAPGKAGQGEKRICESLGFGLRRQLKGDALASISRLNCFSEHGTLATLLDR